MDFLKDVLEDDRATVHKVIVNEVLTLEEKLDLLKDLIEDRHTFQTAAHFLQQKETEEKRDENETLGDEEKEETDTGDEENDIDEENNSFFEQLPDCLTILLLGETGAGKSTFINGLVNQLKFDTLWEAMHDGPEVVIKTSFIHLSSDLKETNINCDPTVEVRTETPEDEETTERGMDATQFPRSHLITFGPIGHQKQLCLIDTPGFGSVRGRIHDQTNLSLIREFVAHFRKIDAVLVFMQDNRPRMTLHLKNMINDTLSLLPTEAQKNILFCFTHARSSFYTPRETVYTLRNGLDQLKTWGNVEIQLNRDTMYCFDYECFRFLCVYSKGMSFVKADVESINESWNNNKRDILRLLNHVIVLEPIEQRIRTPPKDPRGLQRILEEFNRLYYANLVQVQQKEREIEEQIQSADELLKRLYVRQVKLVPMELGYPNSVCTSKTCVDFIQQSPGGPITTVYKSKCHQSCSCLENLTQQVEIYPNPDLKNCWAMALDENRCRTCKCPWSSHMSIRYELKEEIVEEVDPMVEKILRELNDQVGPARIFIEKLRKKANELLEENKQSSDFIALTRILSREPLLNQTKINLGPCWMSKIEITTSEQS